MTIATIAVKGSASDNFPADFAIVQFGNGFNAPSRSKALAGGNAVIARLRDALEHFGAGVRETKIRSLSVQETFDYTGPDRVRESSGWLAQLSGELHVEPATVAFVVAELTRVGVTIYQLRWELDPDTETQAQRALRRLAVTNARDAANDFALALGATLGSLITLADPGLLGTLALPNGGRRSSHMAMASASAGGSWEGHIDLDPEEITVSAGVEASYEVIMD